mmetsp:Transcript_313/g.702  ORF Transcript_313/g.702 Transcript_313/m.702 type:complete len:261 (+) Transcript_313:207-989(+)
MPSEILFLFAGSPMNSQEMNSGINEFSIEREGGPRSVKGDVRRVVEFVWIGFGIWQQPNLDGKGNFQVLDEMFYQGQEFFLLFQQKGSIISPFGNSLGTSTIDINSVDVGFHQSGSFQHGIGIAPTELGNEGTIGFGPCPSEFLSIGLGGQDELGMNHGCVTEIGSIPSAEHSKGKIGLVDHGGNDKSLFVISCVGIWILFQEFGYPLSINGNWGLKCCGVGFGNHRFLAHCRLGHCHFASVLFVILLWASKIEFGSRFQ